MIFIIIASGSVFEMDRAFDTFEKSIVFAISITKSKYHSRKQYKCPCCHNEVLYVNAKKVTPYFKHRDGNNNAECENYFRQVLAQNQNQYSPKKKELVDFYFDNNKKMFFLGIRLSENKINSYEQKAASFELLTSKNEKAISPKLINNQNFLHNNLTLIPIEVFSFSYIFKIYCKFTYENEIEEHKVFNSIGNPTYSENFVLVKSFICEIFESIFILSLLFAIVKQLVDENRYLWYNAINLFAEI